MKMKRITSLWVISILVLSITSAIPVQAKETDEYLQEIKQIKDLLMNSYIGENLSEQELFEAAMDGMMSTLDKYTVFYNKEESLQFFNSVNSSYVGIGVRLEVQFGRAVITEVFNGGAAKDAGIIIDDEIISVNGKEIGSGKITTDDLSGIIDKIVGEKGTYVKIGFMRGTMTFEEKLERRAIIVPTVQDIDITEENYAITSENLDKIAAYKVSSFASNTDEELSVKIKKDIASGVNYLVLDMRGNGGGYLDTAVNMCKELIPAGNIVTLTNKEGELQTETSTLLKAPFKVVLIVNGNSASATEIFAAAVKDSKAGVVVGEKTFGKGVAQKLYRIGTDYIAKVTTQEFYSPNGDKINGKGVTPNVVVDVPEYVQSDQRLFPGDTFDEVKHVEDMLQFLGYFTESPDRSYTNATYRAIWAFQRETGLYPYGVCDFTTQAKLNYMYREAYKKNDLQMKEAVNWIVQDIQNDQIQQ